MALAIRSAQTGKSKGTIIFWLILTMILGAAFLAVKFTFEWYRDYVEHIVPGVYFGFENRPEWGANAPHVQMFMCFYFFMTGLHALHMIVGLGILTVLVIMTASDKFSPAILRAARDQRPVLALRRYRVDFPVPAAVLDWRALPGWS